MSREYNKIPDVIRAAKRARKKALTKAALIVHGSVVLLCPVLSGNLRSSYDWEASEEEAVVGTNVDYAPYVEYGTRRMAAQPHLRPALDQNIDNITRLLGAEVKMAIDGVVR